MAFSFKRLFGGDAVSDDGWVTPAGLSPMLTNDAGPMVVDVRGVDEFTGPMGHIPGAVNIPLDQFAARVAEVTDSDRPVVMVCHTDRRSSAAAQHLRALGHADVAVLRGGMVAWRQNGLPTE